LVANIFGYLLIVTASGIFVHDKNNNNNNSHSVISDCACAK